MSPSTRRLRSRVHLGARWTGRRFADDHRYHPDNDTRPQPVRYFSTPITKDIWGGYVTDVSGAFTFRMGGASGWLQRYMTTARSSAQRSVVGRGSRGYAAKRLQKVGTPLQVIMQVGGWKREAMPTRYIGKYDESELKAFPTVDLRSLLRGA